jgi:hypothetical protein
MSRGSDYTNDKPTRKHMLTLPENTAALLKYVAAWEKETMSKIVIRQINALLRDWKQANPEKYELWRQTHENCRD